mgnify:CR=1 FL=1
MKKIINGKRYNTETAMLLYEYVSDYSRSDGNYYKESLYKKRTGEYFLFGEGGGLSPYAEYLSGYGCYTYGYDIRPLSFKEAQKWAEDHMEVEEYDKIFLVKEEDVKNWVLEKCKYFSMKEICQLANINYQIFGNWKNNQEKYYFSFEKLLKLKETMQKVAEE